MVAEDMKVAITYYRIVIISVLQYFLFAYVSPETKGYDLPALPDLARMHDTMKMLDGPYLNATSSGHNNIPRIFFITMKTVPKLYHNLPRHMQKYLNHHGRWSSVIVDDAYADKFMRIVFAGTSVLWAYESINPALGAAKADIWRYAVLYAYGGVYIDQDATFYSNLDRFILPTDKFIMSSEGKTADVCYKSSYFLSQQPPIFINNTILQWLIFSAPQHPFIAQTMINIVDVVKSVYRRESVLLPDMHPKFKAIICTTGPEMFTNSISQTMSTISIDTLGYRHCGVDFSIIGGKYKESATVELNGPNHYTNLMKYGTPLLHTTETYWQHWTRIYYSYWYSSS